MNQQSKKDTLACFNKQICDVVISMFKKRLPIYLSSGKLNADLLWTILIYASINQITIEAACQELECAPSANTVREHLNKEFEESEETLLELEERVNKILHDGLPESVKQKLRKKRVRKWQGIGPIWLITVRLRRDKVQFGRQSQRMGQVNFSHLPRLPLYIKPEE
jgi:hypothetical protein